MAVLIKNMEIPKFCDACPFACWSNLHQTGSCYLLDSEQCFDDYSTEYRTKRSELCPLIEVPEPHGRLGDLDAIKKQIDYIANLPWNKDVGTSGGMIAALEVVEDAPTIIPASEKEG